jgi:hypothetical protein
VLTGKPPTQPFSLAYISESSLVLKDFTPSSKVKFTGVDEPVTFPELVPDFFMRSASCRCRSRSLEETYKERNTREEKRIV